MRRRFNTCRFAGFRERFTRMTKSTDRIAPLSVRRAEKARATIGVVLKQDGVVAVQGREGSDCLEQARFARYPEDFGAGGAMLENKARFASAVIRGLVDDPASCDIRLGLADSDVYVLNLPAVGDEETDAVALLSASRISPVNPEENSFDYRIQRTPGTSDTSDGIGSSADSKKQASQEAEKKLQNSLSKEEPASRKATAVSASTAIVNAWKKAFADCGITLSAITSERIASALLCARYPKKNNRRIYGLLAVDREESGLTIIDNGTVVLQRTFNFGVEQLLAEAVDRLSEKSPADATETEAQRRERLLHEAKNILSAGEVHTTENIELSESIQAAVERYVKYLERTYNYYERVEHGTVPEALYIIASHGVVQALVQSFEDKLGVPCERSVIDRIVAKGAEAQMLEVRNQYKSLALYEAAGLACADEHTPNLLELPAERRRKAKLKRAVRIVSAVFGVLGVLSLGAAAWFGSAWMEESDKLKLKEAELASIGKPLSAADLQNEMTSLEALEREGVSVLERRRFAGLLGELASVRGADVYIRSVELTPGEDLAEAAKKRNRREVNRNGEKTKPADVLDLKVSLYGSTQEREAALAEFIKRLESFSKGGTITVMPEKSQDQGASYAIRMTGGF